jgi:hypothetical protein
MNQRVIETPTGWMVRCQACGWHEYPKVGRPGAAWTFNGDLLNPTFTPSMNEHVNPPNSPHYNPDVATVRCHFFVTAGNIQYQLDCTHSLRGQTLPLQAWDDYEIKRYKVIMAENAARRSPSV